MSEKFYFFNGLIRLESELFTIKWVSEYQIIDAEKEKKSE